MGREEDEEFRRSQRIDRTYAPKKNSRILEDLQGEYEREEDFLEGARYARDGAKENRKGYSRKDVKDINRRVRKIEKYHQGTAKMIEVEKKRKSRARNYTGKRGTMKKAKNKKNKGAKPKAKLAALLLAGALGVSSLSCAYNNTQEPVTITQMEENGENTENLSLSNATIATFKNYDQLFEDFENGEYDYNDMSADTVVDMTEELESLTLSTIKEKMSNLTGVDVKNIKVYYSFENSDGTYHVSITTNKGSYYEETWRNREFIDNIFSKKENNIPEELKDVITQIESLRNLGNDVTKDAADGKISYKKYLKQLQSYYENIEDIATSDWKLDENKNITVTEHEIEQTKANTTQNLTNAKEDEQER